MSSMASLCNAKGRGLQSEGLRVKETADFKVYTKGVGTGELKVTIKGPKGLEELCKRKDLGHGVYSFEYYPTTTGTYSISITWGGQHIPNSPFEVKIGCEAGQQKVRVWGPGLEGGVVGKSSDFVVEAVGDNEGSLSIAVEGPSQVKLKCEEGDGYANVRYWPTKAGEYAVHVLCDDEEIQHSPFMAEIVNPPGEDFYPDKVKAYGPGLQSTGLVVGEPTEFTVDAKQGGKAPLKILAQDGEGSLVVVQVKDNGNGTYTCTYTTHKLGRHIVMVSWGGVNILDSPFLLLSMASLCNAKGRGLQSEGLRVKETADFKVYTKGVGTGELKVTIKGPKGLEELCKRKDLGHGVYSFEYYPTTTGTYSISITWGGQHIPNSPFEVKIGCEAGQQKVRVWGPGLEGGVVGKSSDFVVEAVGDNEGSLSITVEGPSQAKIEYEDMGGDGSDNVRYWPTKAGEYAVHVLCDDQEIQHSPFMAEIVNPPGEDFYPDKVKAYGPGLQSTGLVVGEPTEFTVDAKQGGKAPLKILAQTHHRLWIHKKHQPELSNMCPVLVGQVKKLAAQFEESRYQRKEMQSELDKIRQRQAEADKKLASLSLDVTPKATIRELEESSRRQQKVIQDQLDKYADQVQKMQKMQSDVEMLVQKQTETDKKQTSLSLDVTQNTIKEMEASKRQQKVNQDLQDQLQKLTVEVKETKSVMKEMQSELQQLKCASANHQHLTHAEAAKKLLSVREKFIKGSSKSTLHSLLDKLLTKGVISDDEMEEAMGKKLRADKARYVIDTVRRKGNNASSEMIDMIDQLDRNLSDLLQLKPPPTTVTIL